MAVRRSPHASGHCYNSFVTTATEPDDELRCFEFVTPPPGTALFTAAFELGEANSRQLGMLPHAAWTEFASEGRILVALNGTGSFAGYAAFRLPGERVTLVHLVVPVDARGTGAAKALTKELSRRYPDRRGILASCRRDYPAHHMWPKLGFISQGDRKGRGRAGHLLTMWWLDHAHVDLLSWQGPPASATPVVIDANIFLDLHSTRNSQQAPITHRVLQTLEGSVELLVTPELSNEIDRKVDAADRARVRRDLATYPPLAVRFDAMQALYEQLVTELQRRPASAQDISDVRHVAYAIAAGVSVLVTRDGNATDRLRAAAQHVGALSIVSPGELVVLIDSLENESRYAPIALMGTGYTLKSVMDVDRPHLRLFLDHGRGERWAALTARLDSLAAQIPISTRVVLRDPDGNPVGLLGAEPALDALDVTLCRVRSGALQATIAAQVVSVLRPLAQKLQRSAIRVTDPHCGAVILEALAGDGYVVITEGTAVALTLSHTCQANELGALVADSIRLLPAPERSALERTLDLGLDPAASMAPDAAATVEHALRPLRIANADLPTWLVPINPHFASDLLGWPEQLFDRPNGLGVSVEHVYYKGSKNAEQVPGRVLWYASAPELKVFACSELVEVIDGGPDELWRRFRRLGVYERQNVIAQANGRSWVRALRVINTEILARPVPLSELRRLAARNGQSLQLASAWRVSTGLFADILEAGR